MTLPSLDIKRILLAILLIVISVALAGGIIWLVFLRTPAEVGPGGGVVSPGGTLPGTGEGEGGKVIQPGGKLTGEDGEIIEIPADISEETRPTAVAQGSLTEVGSLMAEAVGAINYSGRSFNYLSGEDGRFYRLSLDGTEKFLLSEESFKFVDKAVWSPDGDKVIMEFPDGANIIYDFNKNKKTTLPSGAEDFTFDRDSEQIAYKYVGSTEDENWLVVSDTNNSGAEAVEPVGDQGHNVQVNWSPDNSVVAWYHKPTGLESEEVFFIGLNDENFKSLKVQGSNFKGVWSPAGDRILYETIRAENNYNPVLSISDGNGDSIGNNNFDLGLATWVDKCAFGGDQRTVYCAVPINLETGAGLYPEIVNKSPDVFYKIDLNSGVSKLIAYPVFSENLSEFQVKKLFVSDDQSKLYFWDGLSGKVYFMRLK